jgi:hypothetical protein
VKSTTDHVRGLIQLTTRMEADANVKATKLSSDPVMNVVIPIIHSRDEHGFAFTWAMQWEVHVNKEESSCARYAASTSSPSPGVTIALPLPAGSAQH